MVTGYVGKKQSDTDSGGPSLGKGPEDSSHTARLRTNFILALDWNKQDYYIRLILEEIW